jgi:hypothetical protein
MTIAYEPIGRHDTDVCFASESPVEKKCLSEAVETREILISPLPAYLAILFTFQVRSYVRFDHFFKKLQFV